MPPRKSTDNADGETISTPKGASSGSSVEDFNLPRSMITRLAKGVLPANTQIQKDAIIAISKSATVFVNYIAANAQDRCELAGKKTVQPQDVLDALQELEFETFLPRAEAELAKYNQVQTDKRNNYRRRVKEEKGSGDKEDDAATNEEPSTLSATSKPKTSRTNGRADSPPAAKKARRSRAGDPDATEDEEAEPLDEDETIEDDEPADEEEEEDDEDDDEAMVSAQEEIIDDLEDPVDVEEEGGGGLENGDAEDSDSE